MRTLKNIQMFEDYVDQKYLDDNKDFYLSDIPKYKKNTFKLFGGSDENTQVTLSPEQEFLKNISVDDISFKYKGIKDGDMKVYTIQIANATNKVYELFDNYTISIQNQGKVLTSEGRLGNRFHILDIGLKVRGLGVGLKIYLSAIKYFGYISSDSMQSTPSAKRVWQKLIQNKDYSHIFYNGVIKKLSCEKCNNKKEVGCPQCRGYDPKCSYCNGLGKIKCDRCGEELKSQFVFIGTSNKLKPILDKLIKSSQLEIENMKSDL